MKCLILVKATQDSENGVMPSKEMLAAMGKFNDDLIKAGIMKDADGLMPTTHAKRVRFSGAGRSVIDGPFTPVNEQVAGYWIWDVKSMNEAVEWLKRCPNPMLVGSEIEIRPAYEASDFG